MNDELALNDKAKFYWFTVYTNRGDHTSVNISSNDAASIATASTGLLVDRSLNNFTIGNNAASISATSASLLVDGGLGDDVGFEE